MADEQVVRELLAAVPAGCTWLLPITGDDGRTVDFRVAATSDQVRDIYGRGSQRVDARLRELYPSLADGPLWRLYLQVIATGEPGGMDEFHYDGSRFEISVHRVLGGLLVWWTRVDEHRRRMESIELLGSLG